MNTIPFWEESEKTLFQKLDTSLQGLTEKAAEERLKKFGPNAIKGTKKATVLSLFLGQFANPLVLILIFAASLSLFLHDKTDALIILAIVVLSGLLGFWQEKKAVRAVESLQKMIQIKTTVLRNRIFQELPLDQVVPGDVIFLNAGDVVPADCFILESKDLFIDESVLTGESYPVEKQTKNNFHTSAVKDRSSALFLGCHVVSGTVTALVITTGKKTEFGKIAECLKLKPPLTEFELNIRHFGYFLMEITLILVIIIFALNIFLHKHVIESFLFALAIAVGLTPQLLPAIISVNLAHGAKKNG